MLCVWALLCICLSDIGLVLRLLAQHRIRTWSARLVLCSQTQPVLNTRTQHTHRLSPETLTDNNNKSFRQHSSSHWLKQSTRDPYIHLSYFCLLPFICLQFSIKAEVGLEIQNNFIKFYLKSISSTSVSHQIQSNTETERRFTKTFKCLSVGA